ncbi:Flp pilus assembly protein CpaB [Phytopseudomonas dryadis]|uniref:Flp pilus assembly protein CpaB n=1 Tax=Phytopseudomonas dryadis TaxID=2487520 RepID=A0A4V2KBY2_9GAMM|nr:MULTISPECIES: Flp pilus assembly protein CpaB [Pseudomonas]TBU90025.1 Flp pilus assembly protein CpaB [Pseudomonas dryadis]TBV02661.1 Flp pilus assembly protein CpaB [Pseudomonas dryadis]TBV15513.1 Flp pilus assembly protein CpaB [Pseudomonas sp. FRB 230]
MKTPSILLLAGTLLVAGSAALLARVLLTPPPPPTAVVETAPPVVEPKPVHPAILVTSRDLLPGDFIDASALRWQASETAHDERLYFIEGGEEGKQLTGASVRQPIKAGAALTSNLVVKANEPGFIATVVKPGMRAIAVPTSNSASLYSMLSLGDRVDVLVNLQRTQEQALVNPVNQEQIPRLAAQTLLQDVRVLSINNRMRSPLQPLPTPDPKAAKKNPDAYPESYPDIVTLEVPPAYAERLALASQIGTLHLVLRSRLEESDGQVKPGSDRVTTLAQTTGVYQASAPASAPNVNTFRGDAATAVQFGSR